MSYISYVYIHNKNKVIRNHETHNLVREAIRRVVIIYQTVEV